MAADTTSVFSPTPFQSSFASLKTWISELQHHGSPNAVLAIAGNKCDLEDLREVPYKGQ